jgi:hypothetical protein
VCLGGSGATTEWCLVSIKRRRNNLESMPTGWWGGLHYHVLAEKWRVRSGRLFLSPLLLLLLSLSQPVAEVVVLLTGDTSRERKQSQGDILFANGKGEKGDSLAKLGACQPEKVPSSRPVRCDRIRQQFVIVVSTAAAC